MNMGDTLHMGDGPDMVWWQYKQPWIITGPHYILQLLSYPRLITLSCCCIVVSSFHVVILSFHHVWPRGIPYPESSPSHC